MKYTDKELYDLGQNDCAENKIPQSGMPDAYYDGYSDQYAMEQQLMKVEIV